MNNGSWRSTSWVSPWVSVFGAAQSQTAQSECWQWKCIFFISVFFFRDITHNQTSHSISDCISSFKLHMTPTRSKWKINDIRRHFHHPLQDKGSRPPLIFNQKLRIQAEIKRETAASSFCTCKERHATLMCASQWNRLDESGGSCENRSSREEMAKVAWDTTATLGKHSYILRQGQSTLQHLD